MRPKGWQQLLSVAWEADGKGLFVFDGPSGKAVLLHMDLGGQRSGPVEEQRGCGWLWSTPIPGWPPSCAAGFRHREQRLDDGEPLIGHGHRFGDGAGRPAAPSPNASGVPSAQSDGGSTQRKLAASSMLPVPM